MQVKVHMLAFGDGAIRMVDIPFEDLPGDPRSGDHLDRLLDAAFYYGQNDFQPQPLPSVSVGDVIELDNGSLHRVEGVGFKLLPDNTDLSTLIGKFR